MCSFISGKDFCVRRSLMSRAHKENQCGISLLPPVRLSRSCEPPLRSGRSDDRVDTLTWKWAGGAWSRAETGPPITSLQPPATTPDGTVFTYQTQAWLAAPVLHVRSPAGVWRSISLPTQPAPRNAAACGYDAARKRLILYGGSASRGPIRFADKWEFDRRQWTKK